MRFTSMMYLGVSGYWQGIIDIHSSVPSPWGEGWVRGCEYEARPFGIERERLIRFVDKREGGISLPLFYLPLATAFNRFRHWLAS